MSKAISLFSGYNQRENRVTNYCLLILKMLYEENPKYLGEALASLIGEDLSSRVGVSFRQQERRTKSVPDGLIVQQAFTIYIETKNHDWFTDEQLENHLLALSSEVAGTKILLALGNFEADDVNRFSNVRRVCETTYSGNIVFEASTFDDFLVALNIHGLSKTTLDAIADFRAFLNDEDLLPSWRGWLDVVNCAGYPTEVTQGGVYMCPATGGAYNHSRARYFGMYQNKKVERVAEIEAVFDVDISVNTVDLKWRNTTETIVSLQERAVAKVTELRPHEGPTRIFLLGDLIDTSFEKDSFGGMQGSTRYFDISSLKICNSVELAAALTGRKWSQFAGRDQ